MLSRRQFLVTAGLIGCGLKSALSLGSEQEETARCVQRALGGQIYKVWSRENHRDSDEPMRVIGHVVCCDLCVAIRCAHHQFPDRWLRIADQNLSVEMGPHRTPEMLDELIKVVRDQQKFEQCEKINLYQLGNSKKLFRTEKSGGGAS